MLCPFHGDYNSKLDRCPSCATAQRVHARRLRRETPDVVKQVLAECDAIEANARIYSPKDPALPFDTGRLLVVKRIREILGK